MSHADEQHALARTGSHHASTPGVLMSYTHDPSAIEPVRLAQPVILSFSSHSTQTSSRFIPICPNTPPRGGTYRPLGGSPTSGGSALWLKRTDKCGRGKWLAARRSGGGYPSRARNSLD